MNGAASVTVSVWSLAVSSARLETFRALLSPDERARADRIGLGGLAQEFVASRGMVRELLASACGCEPRAISIGIGARGKPYLEHPSLPLAFNLSHSGGYCALAVGAFPAIGVDIQALRDTVGDIAKNVFSMREAAAYTAVAPADRMRVFFRAWVAKEAYLKAKGTGLAGGLKSLELDLTAVPNINPLAIGSDAASPCAWSFQSFDVTETIVGAVAIEKGCRDIAIRIRHIDAE
jgi:4'-phosphopantetheinyl transferase